MVRFARRSFPLPAAPLGVMALALLLIRLGIVSPLAGFGAFILAWAGGGVALLAAGAIALGRGTSEPGTARWRILGGALLLGTLVLVAYRGRGPAIHDITTDLQDPPSFAVPLLPGQPDRDMAYPRGGSDVPALQRAAYPGIRSLSVRAPRERVFAAALDAAHQLGWTITSSDPQRGRIEAFAVTRLFRFVDDIAVRIRPGTEGTVIIDVRSTSRVGRSDMGANAARIRRFLDTLGPLLAVQASQ